LVNRLLQTINACKTNEEKNPRGEFRGAPISRADSIETLEDVIEAPRNIREDRRKREGCPVSLTRGSRRRHNLQKQTQGQFNLGISRKEKKK